MPRKRWFQLLWVLVLLVPSATPVAQEGKVNQVSSPSNDELQTVSLTLDNVTLSITSPFLPGEFTVAGPGDFIQGAAAASHRPFREFTILAIPFGFQSPSEALPVADAGGESSYRNSLHAHRIEQGGIPEAGPTASLFGKRVTSEVSHLSLYLGSEEHKPTVVVEWVVEAGNRLWIVRAAQEDGAEPATSSDSFVASLGDLVIESDTLAAPTTIGASEEIGVSAFEPQNSVTSAAGASLPEPPWWDGKVCDTRDYKKCTGEQAKPLGSNYRGLRTCGPLPQDCGCDCKVYFFSGDPQGAREWQCVELSLRYLYVAYNIEPYPANGSQVVEEYEDEDPDEPIIVAYDNGTEGHAPQPGDVLSCGSTVTLGHTMVVQAAAYDETPGNGTITYIEQNGSLDGSGSLAVTDWVVDPCSIGDVTGWLHPVVDLINPDFEVPEPVRKSATYQAGESFGNWTVMLGSVDLVDEGKWEAASKRQSVDLNGSRPYATQGSISQSVVTVPGETYRLSFSLAGNPEGAPTVKTMNVVWGDEIVDTLTFDTMGHSTDDMGWTTHTYTLVAGSDTTLLGFASMTPNSVYGPVIDNVRLTIPAPAPLSAVSSYFDGTDVEGWSLYLGTLQNPGSGGSGGGEDNGYLYAAPPNDSKTSYYVAPSEYHGDWRNLAELKLDLWSYGGTYYRSGYSMYGDIYIGSNEKSAQLLFPHRPASTWESFTVYLDDTEDWTLGGGATSIEEILSDVTDFQIRAEYGVGEDFTGLDNVELFSLP